jgi:elongation factor G
MIIVNKIDDAGRHRATRRADPRVFGNDLPADQPAHAGPPRSSTSSSTTATTPRATRPSSLSVHEAHKRIVEQVIEVDDDLTMQYLEVGDGKFDPSNSTRRSRRPGVEPTWSPSASVGQDRRGRRRPAARLRQPVPQPGRGQSAEFLRRATTEAARSTNGTPARPAAASSSPTSSRSPPTPSSASWDLPRPPGHRQAQATCFIDDQKKPVKIGHLFKLQGKEHVEVHEVGPGEIGASPRSTR